MQTVNAHSLAAEALLPEPQVLSCFFDDSFAPPLPAMGLLWPESRTIVWKFPGGLRLVGPPPTTFGVRIKRIQASSYLLYLRWDALSLHWRGAETQDIKNSSLAEVLAALKSDLNWLLEQPLDLADLPLHKVA